MTISAPFGFGGEELLIHRPPDYPSERIRMGVMLILAVAAWTIVIPFIVVRTCLDVSRASPQTYKPENGGRKRDKKAKQPGIPSSDDKNASLLGLVTAVCSVMCFLNVFYLILTSPNNSYAARAVLEAPLFTPEECQRILDFSYDAAQRNYDAAMETGDKQSKLLTKPIGWQKSRHSLYPTTDLNLVVDPFTAEAREYIGHRLDARLAPLLERVFGIRPGAIRANDVSRMKLWISTPFSGGGLTFLSLDVCGPI